MLKLIVSDVDGTLLNSDAHISEATCTAIADAQAQGIQFAVATGRGATEIFSLLEEHGIACPVITVNGAAIYDADHQLTRLHPMDYQQTLRLLEALQDFPVVTEVVTSQGIFSDNLDKRLASFIDYLTQSQPGATPQDIDRLKDKFFRHLPIQGVDNLITHLSAHPELSILKFLITAPREQHGALDAVRQAFKDEPNIIITSSNRNNIEINHIAAQKGLAVAELAQSLGIDLADVMTIGDNYNDLSMLTTVGYGVAMGNAPEEIKAQVAYTTDTAHNDGVAKAIYAMITRSQQ